MSRATRLTTATLLALAIALLPVVLDRCAASCEAQHDAVAGTPSCHHALSSAVQIGQIPTPCGHDHHSIAVASSNDSAAARPLFNTMVVVETASTPPSPAGAAHHIPPHSPPGSSLTFNRRSLPLRI